MSILTFRVQAEKAPESKNNLALINPFSVCQATNSPLPVLFLKVK